MRMTVEPDPDTAKEVERYRHEHGQGVSQAINDLIRRGMNRNECPRPFVPRVRDLGLRLDVANITVAIEFLEGPDAR